jgi:mercuric ion transport protein
MRRIGGTFLTVTGFLTCPCHLIITLPLLISLLAGTALGSFLKQNTGLVYTGAGIYFVVALAVGASLLFGRACPDEAQEDAACPRLLSLLKHSDKGRKRPGYPTFCRPQGDNTDVRPRIC